VKKANIYLNKMIFTIGKTKDVYYFIYRANACGNGFGLLETSKLYVYNDYELLLNKV